MNREIEDAFPNFYDPQRSENGYFFYNWLWHLTRHGFYCFTCKNKMPDFEPQYCCNGQDCNCGGYPIDPPICSEECWRILMDNFKDCKYMWE